MADGSIFPPWQRTGPSPNAQYLDAARFVALLQAHPKCWLQNSRIKHVEMRIDVRSGSFTLKDRDGRPLEADDVIRAIERGV